jgi:hypothetical protein
MLRNTSVLVICFLLFAPAVSAQGSKTEVFRKESAALQRAADQAINEVPGISLLQSAKVTYLEEFGVIVTLEVALEPPRNPFSSATQSGSQASEKQQRVRDKMKQFITQKAPGVQTADGLQFIAVVIHLFNSNPVDVPNLPRQMILMVKKQEPTNVILREF